MADERYVEVLLYFSHELAVQTVTKERKLLFRSFWCPQIGKGTSQCKHGPAMAAKYCSIFSLHQAFCLARAPATCIFMLHPCIRV